MKRNRLSFPAWTRVAGVLAIVAAFAMPAAAQSVTSADIQRLQDQVYQASGELSRLRSSNPDTASRLQSDLDDIRDDVVYLTDVRDRLQELRTRATGDVRNDNQGWSTNSSRSGTGSSGGNNGVTGGVSGDQTTDTRTRSTQSTRGGTADERRSDQGARSGSSSDDRTRSDQGTSTRNASGNSAIPEGQEIDVRLENDLSSATAQVEQRFEATTVADLFQGNRVLIPAGSNVRGVVSGVTKTTRMERKGTLTVAFDQLTVNGRAYPIRGTVTQALESEGIRGEATKIGAGAGVGAIIGGIIGGVKGALLGVLIGGGGTVAATEGKDVTLPAGTILRVRLDTPPAIR
jgi:type II secretory pathway pseudopilin PulG